MISETDLILNSKGNVYHLDVNQNNLAKDIILVGDRDRVKMISKYFDKITHISEHREFVTETGYYKGKHLTVMSSGIGTSNIEILLNEIDAIFNIDLKTREVKENLTSLNFYRLGTCGTIDKDISVNSIIVSDYGLGLDNILSYYEGGDNFYEDALNIQIRDYFIYIAESDLDLRKLFPNFHHGITAATPGFYGPQGRNLRIKNYNNTLVDDLLKINYKNLKVLNFEMETSALYGLSKLSGHKAITLNTVIANRITKEFSKDIIVAVDNMIKLFLNKICTI